MRGPGVLRSGWAALLLVLAAFVHPAAAGELTRKDIEKNFPPPLVVGERDDRLPVWPILKQ